MQSQVKELFNYLERNKTKEQKLNPYRKQLRSRRTVGMKPYMYYDVPPITNFSHFIECEIAPDVCPLVWEGLELDFEEKDKRYCSICEKHVYKVDNEYMLEQCKSENKCMAISNELLEKLNGKMEQKQYDNIQKRLLISKLFLYTKKNDADWYHNIQNDKLTYEKQLKKILLNLLNGGLFEDYIEFGIDIKGIFKILLEYVDDEELKSAVSTFSPYEKL